MVQQEIIMMKDCKHSNIVAYFGSYLRYMYTHAIKRLYVSGFNNMFNTFYSVVQGHLVVH